MIWLRADCLGARSRSGRRRTRASTGTRVAATTTAATSTGARTSGTSTRTSTRARTRTSASTEASTSSACTTAATAVTAACRHDQRVKGRNLISRQGRPDFVQIGRAGGVVSVERLVVSVHRSLEVSENRSDFRLLFGCESGDATGTLELLHGDGRSGSRGSASAGARELAGTGCTGGTAATTLAAAGGLTARSGARSARLREGVGCGQAEGENADGNEGFDVRLNHVEVCFGGVEVCG